MSTETILSEAASIYDANGYLTQSGVTVCDCGEIVTIGGTAHAKTDLRINSYRIESLIAGWLVIL